MKMYTKIIDYLHYILIFLKICIENKNSGSKYNGNL